MPDQSVVEAIEAATATTVPAMRVRMNAYLLRSAVDPPDSFADAARDAADFSIVTTTGLDRIEPELARASAVGDTIVATFSRPKGQPAWQTLVSQMLNLDNFGDGIGQALGVAMFTAIADPATGELRWIAWCFGTASKSLSRAAIEPRFGLLVVLNGLDEGQLRQLRHRTPFPYTQQTDHRAAREIPVDGFRIDRLIDLINGAGGTTTAGELHGQLYGAQSVQFRHLVSSVDDLHGMATDLMATYRLDMYRKEFAWIDNYVVVEDQVLVARLTELVITGILHDPSIVDVLLPDEGLEDRVDQCIARVVFPRRRRTTSTDPVLTSDMVAKYLTDVPRSSIHDVFRFVDDNGDLVVEVPLIACLATEVRVEGNRYVLYNGDFYLVDGAFVDRLDEEVRSIRLTEIELPNHQGEREPEWNKRVAAAKPDVLCLDTNLVSVPGHGRFEPCDLVTTAGAMIHVKRWGQASKMTYVFTQAVQGAKMLSQSQDARDRLDERVVAANPNRPHTTDRVRKALASLEKPAPGNEIVIAILGQWRPGQDLTRLPLLAKLSLVDAVRNLTLMGYKPSVAMVGLG